MKIAMGLLLVFFICLTGFTCLVVGFVLGGGTKPQRAMDRYVTFDLVNEYRVRSGQSPLVFNPQLCAYSDDRVLQLNKDFSHNNFLPQAKKYIGNYYKAGENLANGYFTEKEEVEAWVNSPGHRANIVDPEFTDTCISVTDSNFHTYAVQVFASYNQKAPK